MALRVRSLLLIMAFVVCPGVWGYTQSELDAANATIALARTSIDEVDAILDSNPSLKDDLEVSLKLSEATIKLNSAISYFDAAVDTNPSNPDLASTFLTFSVTSATEAKTLADSARTLAIAKNLSAAATEEELKKKIESISADLDEYSQESTDLETKMDSIAETITDLKSRGISVTNAEEKYQEAIILKDHSATVHDTAAQAFDSGDYDTAQTSITTALQELIEAGIKADSARSFLTLAAGDITSQREEVDRLINETGDNIKDGNVQLDTALEAIEVMEDMGISVDNFRKVLTSNAQHINTATEHHDQAVFRRNFQDYGQAKESSLLALQELDTFRKRMNELFDGLLLLMDPETDGVLNTTQQRLDDAELRYREGLTALEEPHLGFADEALSTARVDLADAKRNKEEGERLWTDGNLTGGILAYLSTHSSLGEADEKLMTVEALLDGLHEIEEFDKNLEELRGLSGSWFSGIGQEDVEEVRSAHLEALVEYQDQNYTSALERLSGNNQRANALIDKAHKTATSLRRGGMLLGYSVFLVLLMGLIEVRGRRKK